jgi:hypothetical protein
MTKAAMPAAAAGWTCVSMRVNEMPPPKPPMTAIGARMRVGE